MKSRPIRAPAEFVAWMKSMDEEHSRQTGYPPNLSATMRRLTNWGSNKLVVKENGFDVILFGKKKKR